MHLNRFLSLTLGLGIQKPINSKAFPKHKRGNGQFEYKRLRRSEVDTQRTRRNSYIFELHPTYVKNNQERRSNHHHIYKNCLDYMFHGRYTD